MMNKIKNFMAKPITWGTYTKLLVFFTLLSLIAAVIYLLAWYKPWENWSFGKKKEEETKEYEAW